MIVPVFQSELYVPAMMPRTIHKIHISHKICILRSALEIDFENNNLADLPHAIVRLSQACIRVADLALLYLTLAIKYFVKMTYGG